MQKINVEKTNSSLDLIKFLCVILIVGSHSLPIFSNSKMNLYYGQWFFRFCVPLFFISSGFYFEKMTEEKQWSYIKRIFIIYVVSMLLFVPIMIKKGIMNSVFSVLYNLLFGYFHLWYLIALCVALLISFLINKKLPLNRNKALYFSCLVVLLAVGIFFDEYCNIFNNTIVNNLSKIINIFGTSRNFLFMALPLITIGRLINVNQEKIFKVKSIYYIILCIVFFVLSFVEVTFLVKRINDSISCDLTIFNVLPAIFLFILTFYWQPKKISKVSRSMRKCIDIVYIIHLIYVLICGYLYIHCFVRFLLVVVLSVLTSVILNLLFNKLKACRKS